MKRPKINLKEAGDGPLFRSQTQVAWSVGGGVIACFSKHEKKTINEKEAGNVPLKPN